MTSMPEIQSDRTVSYPDIVAAAGRIAGVARQTPVMTSSTVDRAIAGSAFFKCENFQRTGSFKFRSAYNALSQLGPEAKERGVLTYSSGNHAQAIALAGKLLDLPTAIVMPADAPPVKVEATRGYGGEIIFYDRDKQDRREVAREVARDRGSPIIPPYDHPHIVAGQGTAAKELLEEVGSLDLLLVSCGGGGLLSGSAIATKSLCPACRVVGVEPELADDAMRSFYSKKLQTARNPQTIADGARTPSLGEVTFPLVLRYVDGMVSVSEDAIRRTLRFLWERLKIVVEPTGALAAAALLEGAIASPGERVGAIVSGGNIDLDRLSSLLSAGDR